MLNTKSLLVCFYTLLIMNLSACIVEPARGPRPYGEIIVPVAPPPGVYVAPVGVAPGRDWTWSYHPRLGYGWYHPHHGWRH